MPAKSQAQRSYLNAKFGHEWVKAHGFDNRGKLPGHVAKKKKPKTAKPKKKPAKKNTARSRKRR